MNFIKFYDGMEVEDDKKRAEYCENINCILFIPVGINDNH